MKALLLGAALAALASPTFAGGSLTFEDGAYVANLQDGNCALLEVEEGQPVAYIYAKKCAPASDVLYTAMDVSIDGENISIDAARFRVTSQGDHFIEGVFSHNGSNFTLRLNRK